MKHINYYLIRPKANLIERVMEYNRVNNIDVNKIFLDTELWSKQMTTRVLDDDRNQVKVLFISDLYAEYLKNDFLQRNNLGLYRFFVEILGLPPYNLDTFNKWWEIEYLGNGVNEFEAYEQDVGRLSVDLFPKTDNPHPHR